MSDRNRDHGRDHDRDHDRDRDRDPDPGALETQAVRERYARRDSGLRPFASIPISANGYQLSPT